MCARLGVGVRLSAPYAQHMLGKAERPWRTLRDNASAMLRNKPKSVPNSIWSCAISSVVYLRNGTYSRNVGRSGGVPLTMLTSKAPPNSASSSALSSPKCMSSYIGKWANKRSVASWSAPDALGYRLYNPATRLITTSVHVVFQEATPGFGARQPIDSVTTDAPNIDDAHDTSSMSHPLALDTHGVPDTPRPLEAARSPRLRSHLIRYGELVAHMFDYPPVLVTSCRALGRERPKRTFSKSRTWPC
jgi:hypothetical protein